MCVLYELFSALAPAKNVYLIPKILVISTKYYVINLYEDEYIDYHKLFIGDCLLLFIFTVCEFMV